jgi:hypothetical protein
VRRAYPSPLLDELPERLKEHAPINPLTHDGYVEQIEALPQQRRVAGARAVPRDLFPFAIRTRSVSTCV